MALGFGYEELQKMFRAEWENHLKEHSEAPKGNKPSMSSEYLAAGFTAAQVEMLSKDKAQMLAKFKAVLKMIDQNNQELEKQLKAKGLL